MEFLLAPAVAAVLTLALWIHRSHRALFPDDPPGKGRKDHGRPTPLVGIAVAPFLVGLAAWHEHYWLCCGIALATLPGAIDDFRKTTGRDLDWRWKGLALLGAAGLATYQLLDLGIFAHPARDAALAFVALFVLANAANFLDNTDGVTGTLAVVGLLMAGHPTLAAAGWIAVGFLPFNWPRAQVFMGDALSLPLGLVMGYVALSRWPEPILMAAPVAILVIDFVQVVCARLYLGRAPWVGDRRHVTHIAMNLGVPRIAIAPLFGGLAALAYVLLTRSAWT